MSGHLSITIARQYGSGGREIGVRVAELLGIKSYDKELITLASQKSGISIEELKSVDERATNSLLYSLAMGTSSHGGPHQPNTARFNMPINDKLFITQSEIIKEISESEDCVIIGRCADYVLREKENVISVFIHADTEERVKRVSERNGIGEIEAREQVAKVDKRRTNYYNFYTGRKWGKYDHYDFSVDSGLFGVEGTAQLIVDIVRRYTKK